MYCGSEGLDTPDGDCDPGYYCPAMSISATPGNTTCPQGYKCVGGLEAPEPCPSGSYQVFIDTYFLVMSPFFYYFFLIECFFYIKISI